MTDDDNDRCRRIIEFTLKCIDRSHCIEKNIELYLEQVVFSSQQRGGLCIGTARHARGRLQLLHCVFPRTTRADDVFRCYRFYCYRRNNSYVLCRGGSKILAWGGQRGHNFKWGHIPGTHSYRRRPQYRINLQYRRAGTISVGEQKLNDFLVGEV